MSLDNLCFNACKLYLAWLINLMVVLVAAISIMQAMIASGRGKKRQAISMETKLAIVKQLDVIEKMIHVAHANGIEQSMVNAFHLSSLPRTLPSTSSSTSSTIYVSLFLIILALSKNVIKI